VRAGRPCADAIAGTFQDRPGRAERRTACTSLGAVTGPDTQDDPQDDPLDDHAALVGQIRSKAVVHGTVVLASGAAADYYVDMRRITLDGEAAPLVGRVMLRLTADLEYDAVGGLTLGADPVATAMLHAAHARGRVLDAFVVRKEGKAHGLQRRIEGPDVEGRAVLVVEDVSTTGGSPLTAAAALQEAGAEVIAVAVIVDRGARAAVEAAGFEYRAAYELADLGLA
jgi:orotate phosphoribosyltransferase